MKKALILLVFGFPFVPLALAGVKTDLQEKGLIGPVQTVRTEEAQFSQRSGQWIEGPHGQPASTTYDRQGNRTEDWYAAKILHTYDTQGNRLETTFHGPDGALLGKTRYIYDDKGFLARKDSVLPVSAVDFRLAPLF
jgi:hypothetical protein